jgi:hypothetical protein
LHGERNSDSMTAPAPHDLIERVKKAIDQEE